MMARAKIDYSTWPTRELIAERRKLLANTAPAANRAQIGHIRRELIRRTGQALRAEQARRTMYPDDKTRRLKEWLENWHLLSRWTPEHAGPLRKPNAVLSVLRHALGAENLPGILGYISKPWEDELDRRAGVTASRKSLRDQAQREEFQAWEHAFAQRVADARAAGARTDRAAAGVVAARLEADIRSLLVDEAGSVRPGMEAAWAVFDGQMRDGFDLHEELTRAIDDVTARWLARTTGMGKRAAPLIRGRVRDPAQTAALEEVLRAALRPGRNS